MAENDLWIAVCAAKLGMVVATGNEKHFAKVCVDQFNPFKSPVP